MPGLKLGLGLSAARSKHQNNRRILDFSGASLPVGVSVSASSLASGYGADGQIAWPAHNLVSPSDNVGWSGWSGASGGSASGNRVTMTASNSTYSKVTTSGVQTTQIGDKIIARMMLRAGSPDDIGKEVRLTCSNQSVFTDGSSVVCVLGAEYQQFEVSLTCTTSNAQQRVGLQGGATTGTRATLIDIMEPSVSRHPMSPKRFVSTSDNTSPYAPNYAGLLDHFVTTGVRRGVRVRNGVETASYTVGAVGIYQVRYIWLNADQTTELSETVSHFAAGGVLTLTPPEGEHILRAEIEGPIPFSLNEFSASGLVFGVSGGGVNGSGADAPIRLSGTAPGGEVIEARIMQGLTVIQDWHSIGTTTSRDWAFKTNRIGRGTGYSVKIRLASIPSVELTMTNTFNVGDLVMRLGSSSMNNWTTGDITAFYNELKNYNGNQPVYSDGPSQGGQVLLAAQGVSNTMYYIQGASEDVASWSDLGLNIKGQQWRNMLVEIGGEVTAIIDASGGNDLGLVGNAEALRVYKIAHSRKWEEANALAGRNIPFIQQALGLQRNNTTTSSDDAQQRIRRAQYEVLDAYAQGHRGAEVWDQALADGIHLVSYETTAIRMARCVARALGYSTTVQARGPYVASASRSGSVITAQINISRGGTSITPASGIVGFRVTDGGVRKTITSVTTTGIASGNLVPVQITVSGGLSGPVMLYHHYGNGLDITTSTDAATVNATKANTIADNGTYSLPLEWLDGLSVS